jgi:hypothetical protein
MLSKYPQEKMTAHHLFSDYLSQSKVGPVPGPAESSSRTVGALCCRGRGRAGPPAATPAGGGLPGLRLGH